MAIARRTRAVMTHGAPHPLGVRGAVGPGFIAVFGASFSTIFSAFFSTNRGRLGASPRCQQQSARKHEGNRPTHRQSLRVVGRQ